MGGIGEAPSSLFTIPTSPTTARVATNHLECVLGDDTLAVVGYAGWLASRCSRWAAKNSAQESTSGCCAQQRATLAFGHTAPDTELHPVVECVGGALGDDRTVPANHGRFSLRRSANEQFVGIGGATPRARHPRDAVLRPPK